MILQFHLELTEGRSKHKSVKQKIHSSHLFWEFGLKIHMWELYENQLICKSIKNKVYQRYVYTRTDSSSIKILRERSESEIEIRALYLDVRSRRCQSNGLDQARFDSQNEDRSISPALLHLASDRRHGRDLSSRNKANEWASAQY